ncbi:MAG: APC family permease [Candidatus Methanodesulfokora sp.]
MEKVALKREVGLLGSFAMGYADVGADVYIALGVVALYAGGAAPLAFIFAAIAYVFTGLAYAELASTYPYAGGAQVYSMRALNDLWGFVAGWALLFDYTVDIALFALASAGYMSFFFPQLLSINFLGVSGLSLFAFFVVLFLIIINILGIKESSSFNIALVIPDVVLEGAVLALGFALAFNFNNFLSQIYQIGNPALLPDVGYINSSNINLQNFVYALTLAMMSYVGIESIAQAAEETRRPDRWIPRATKFSILAVAVFAIGLSILANGLMGWNELVAEMNKPLVAIASRIPLVGKILSIITAFTGFIITLASANTGVIGVSRVVFSMGRFKLLPEWFYHVNRKFRTPTRTIVTFGMLGALMCLFQGLEQTAGMYAFGALLSYILVNISLVKLRNIDRDAYRSWAIPGSIRVGEREYPIVGIAGTITTSIMWILIIIFHPSARLSGTAWILFGVLLYTLYRKKIKMPIMGALGKGNILPGGYNFDALILVREGDPPDLVAEKIAESLDSRFRLNILMIIEVPRMDAEEVRKYREECRKDLKLLESKLKRRFEVRYDIIAIDPLKERCVVENLREEFDKSDVIVLFSTRRRRFGLMGEALPEVLSERYPGKVMVVTLGEI